MKFMPACLIIHLKKEGVLDTWVALLAPCTSDKGGLLIFILTLDLRMISAK